MLWNAECSWECPLSVEAKSPRPTAHTRLQKTRNKSLFSATLATSAPIAERFSARAEISLHVQMRHPSLRAESVNSLHSARMTSVRTNRSDAMQRNLQSTSAMTRAIAFGNLSMKRVNIACTVQLSRCVRVRFRRFSNSMRRDKSICDSPEGREAGIRCNPSHRQLCADSDLCKVWRTAQKCQWSRSYFLQRNFPKADVRGS